MYVCNQSSGSCRHDMFEDKSISIKMKSKNRKKNSFSSIRTHGVMERGNQNLVVLC